MSAPRARLIVLFVAAASCQWPPDPKECEDVEQGESRILYHQTSPEIAQKILEEGFKPGNEGYCGGAIYFAESPWITTVKAFGPESEKGAILEVLVYMGKTCYMGPNCVRIDGWDDGETAQLYADYIWDQGYDSIRFTPDHRGGYGEEFVIRDKRHARPLRIIQSSCEDNGRPIIPGTVCLSSSPGLQSRAPGLFLPLLSVGSVVLITCIAARRALAFGVWRTTPSDACHDDATGVMLIATIPDEAVDISLHRQAKLPQEDLAPVRQS